MYRYNYGMNYTVLRYPNVYGPRQDPHGEAGVVAIFTGQMLRDEQTIINGDGEQERDFVHVEDCARASLLAIEKGINEGIYNLGTGRGTSVNEIFSTLKEITQYPLDPVYGPAIVGETRKIYLDAQKANLELGWFPEIDLAEGLENTVDYFRQLEGAR
jgi:UDP-glucose 4-epimerase